MQAVSHLEPPVVSKRSISKPAGWAAAIVSMAAVSIVTPIGRAVIAGGMDPTTLLAGRFVLATLLMSTGLLVAGRNRFRIDRRGLLVCGGAGLLNGLTVLAYFSALGRLTASIAAMLASLSTLGVLLLLALRGERLTSRNLVRLAVGLGGVYLLIGPGGRVDLTGVLLVLAALCTYSLYVAIIQWYLQTYDNWTATYYLLISTTITVVGFWLARGGEWHDPGRAGWQAIAALALLGTLLSRLTLFVAIGGIGSGQFALLAPLETLLAVLWSVLFLHERLEPLQWIGGALILASAALVPRRLEHIPHEPLPAQGVTSGMA